MRVLLINPNTSVHITERLAASARVALSEGEQLSAVTARNGPAAVREPAQLAAAENNALELAAAHAAGHDAIALGISLDGAAPRLRERYPALAVVGMTEAALLTACLHSERIGLLTVGAAMLPLYRQRVEQIGVAGRVVGWQAPELDAAFSVPGTAAETGVLDGLTTACFSLRDAGAGSIVLAGAVLCGHASALAARSGLPVFDGVACAIGQLRLQLAQRRMLRR
ncbi:aspartate/glutamate racemase family protein [Piscinibacter sakaiensis]|uniref:aspartate/glutamate racemase family protein n=1 Tax=Piscinibacter sakaiensis TaxID=1547922 RepID=UPI003AAF21A7